MIGLIKLARPKQWIKNLLVITAPLAAGSLFDHGVLGWTVLAFVCFSLASSAIYMFNDIRDVEADRAHPKKQHRPIASGRVKPATATVAAIVCGLASFGVPLLLGNRPLTLVIVSYLALQIGYVFYLKYEPVFDIAAIAAGFLLRAIAGGAASDVPISNAFLIVVGFGSLFMAVGKRYSEIREQDGSAKTRAVLAKYTPGYLQMMLGVSAAIALVGYILWAFEIVESSSASIPYASLSIIPFTLAMMRYARDAEQAKAEAPEDAVFADKALLVLGLIWLLLFVGQVWQR